MFKPYAKRSTFEYITAAWVSDIIDSWPSLYMGLLHARIRNARHRIVSPRHALTIEAFPRSGSSFTHQAFERANPETHHRIASHIHRSSQVLRSAALGLPTLIIARKPRDAVTSLLALAVQEGQLVIPSPKEASRCMKVTLNRYAAFYERTKGVPGIMVVGFDEVTGDLGSVILRLNRRFDTNFSEFEHTEENVTGLISTAKRHLGPNSERDAIKSRLAEAYFRPELEKARGRADRAFEAIMRQRDTQRAEDRI